ncbi:uncharacterized protein LOC120675341 [Panicum virgatum]|uniref:uncharacterized protein LOC120675341 n=1 Tax=Panicum virgatum TaxID=38727 RepID=UPI0019D6876B|nr:uncharacterized protein LOC120675341 [Panicum virgatum]
MPARRDLALVGTPSRPDQSRAYRPKPATPVAVRQSLSALAAHPSPQRHCPSRVTCPHPCKARHERNSSLFRKQKDGTPRCFFLANDSKQKEFDAHTRNSSEGRITIKIKGLNCHD